MNTKFLTVFIAAMVILVSWIGIAIFNEWSNTHIITYAQDDTDANKQALNVTGQGKVMAKPDTALINMGVRTENEDAKAAQAENTQKMEAVMAKLQELGIAHEDIKTIGYSIRPQYDYSNNKSTLKGYQVDNMLRITVKDTTKLGEIIDQAAQSGVNQIDSVVFSLSDPDKIYNEAIAKAIENAKEKANIMANTAGVAIKSILNINETNTGYQPIYDYSYTMKTAENAGVSPISTGQLEVQANVTITFELQ